ncbi:hypothetical protein [Cupriavidus sp. TMH.W2]|uniref:hypothetical protein n=1 Tax=Cupriavidus sp. TMH.W2 TaxID=3434465 RepID=UPI003D76D54A
MMVIGTSYFESRAAADRYYREYGYPDAEIPLAEGAIQIGRPMLKPGEMLSIIPGEGRYQIHVGEKPLIELASDLDAEIALLVADGDKIRLPKVHLSQYGAIKGMLENAGGRYDIKGYFKFPEGIDVTGVLSGLIAGEVVNGKKESQSFFTPDDIAYRVCRSAGPLTGRRVLEPSAGDGALADVAEAAGAEVVVVENYPPNVLRLEGKGYTVVARDFMTVTRDQIGTFDVILANPPFSKNQDIDHIRHMWTFLKPGGYLSTIASKAWQTGSQRKQREFREFLERHQAEVVEIEAGAFKESGTSVATVHICIQKSERLAEAQYVAPVAGAVSQDQLGLQF